VNAIQGTLSEFEKAPIREWLLQQQYKELHIHHVLLLLVYLYYQTYNPP